MLNRTNKMINSEFSDTTVKLNCVNMATLHTIHIGIYIYICMFLCPITFPFLNVFVNSRNVSYCEVF